ncbi:hypothetical protein [Salinibaculum rarum]|uniref:hypothetical protein n=1 Tax=Salinibaculum rarum TaxID=3058903 RepID=UPI00265FFF73|nr:hypothetical protein [Salinibaculum sp. KK48]
MYDPTASDSPHLSGAQPTWGDLPYACELVKAHWDRSGETEEDIIEQVAIDAEQTKPSQIRTFLGSNKLGLLGEDGSLRPQGMWLARNFESPSQQGLDGEPNVGAKETLSPVEQSLFGSLLFERNWVPMLATVNLLATEPVADTETEVRAEKFQMRIEHLDGYRNVDSINAWKKKVQAHLAWALHLDLAYETSHNELNTTGFGQQVHENLQTLYHPEWP